MFHNVENTYDTLECVIEREGLEDEVIWSRSFGELLKSGAYEIMQYTGLKDSKGVKVFEGDILRLPNEHYKLFKSWEWEGKEDGIYKVFFDQKIASFLAEDQHLKTIYLWLPVNHGAEVIGNIYQNPELLPELSTTRGEE
jgi:uncharacterized phage protein (TIGR01671 family)